MSEKLTVYCRRELAHFVGSKKALKSVAVYRDRDATNHWCTFPWHRSKPDKRYKWVTINCTRWRVVWLADL